MELRELSMQLPAQVADQDARIPSPEQAALERLDHQYGTWKRERELASDYQRNAGLVNSVRDARTRSRDRSNVSTFAARDRDD